MIGRKCGYIEVGLFDLSLPLSIVSVQGGEHLSFSKRANSLVHARYGIRITTGCGIQFSIFNAKALGFVVFRSKHYRLSPLQSGWFNDFLRMHFVNLSFFDLSGLKSIPVECIVYRLGILTRKLSAMLCDVHLSEVAVSHGLKPAKHIRKLIAVCRVIIQKLDFFLPVKLKVWVVSCFHVFVACHLDISIHQRLVAHCIF